MKPVGILPVILAVLSLGGVCVAADVKIAAVDMAKAVSAHPDTKDADALLEKQLDEMETHKSEMVGRLRKLNDELETVHKEAMSRALSEEGRAQKMDVVREKATKVAKFDQQMRRTISEERKQLGDLKSRMQRRIVDKIKEIIKTIAAAEGYALVLDSSAVGISGVDAVLFAAGKTDITDAVIGKFPQAGAKKPGE